MHDSIHHLFHSLFTQQTLTESLPHTGPYVGQWRYNWARYIPIGKSGSDKQTIWSAGHYNTEHYILGARRVQSSGGKEKGFQESAGTTCTGSWPILDRSPSHFATWDSIPGFVLCYQRGIYLTVKDLDCGACLRNPSSATERFYDLAPVTLARGTLFPHFQKGDNFRIYLIG